MLDEDVPEAEDSEPKEVFAFFGLAAYLASCLEEQLSSFAAMLYLITQAPVTREVVEDTFDTMERHTLGRLLTEARKLTTFTAEVDERHYKRRYGNVTS